MRLTCMAWLRAVVVVVVVSALAGCGGSGGRLTEADFHKRANDICEKGTPAKPPTVSTASALETVVNSGLSRVAELGRLRPPARDEEAFRTMLATLNRIGSYEKTNASKLFGGHSSPANVLRPIFRASRALRTESQALGLTSCVDEIRLRVSIGFSP